MTEIGAIEGGDVGGRIERGHALITPFSSPEVDEALAGHAVLTGHAVPVGRAGLAGPGPFVVGVRLEAFREVANGSSLALGHADAGGYEASMRRLLDLFVQIVHGGHFPSYGALRHGDIIGAWLDR